jgi:hypothetical protein
MTQPAQKSKRSFSLRKPRKVEWGTYRCEVCQDKEIPQTRPPRYAEHAVDLKTSKGSVEMILCTEHLLAAQALEEFLEVRDDCEASAIAPEFH